MREGTRAGSGPLAGGTADADGAAGEPSAAPVATRTAAYAELYRTRNRQLVAYATSLTGSPQTAADLVAEAHFRVWRRLRAGQEVENLAGALVATVRDLAAALGRARRETARDRREPADGAPGAASPPLVLGWAAGAVASRDPEQRDSHVDQLTRLLEQLPERWAAALWHAEVEDLPTEGVGARVGVSAATATAMVARARGRLRQAFLLGQAGAPAAEACAEYWRLLPSVVRGTASERRTRQVATHTATCDDCRIRMLALAEADARLPQLLGPALLAHALATQAVGGLRAIAVPEAGAGAEPAAAAGADPDAGSVARRPASTVARTGSRAGAARHARTKAGILSSPRGRALMKALSPARGLVAGSVGAVGVAAAATAFAFATAGPHHAAAAAAAARPRTTATTLSPAATRAGVAAPTGAGATTAGTTAAAGSASGAATAAASAPGSGTTAAQASRPAQAAAVPATQTSTTSQAAQTSAPAAGGTTSSASATPALTPTQTPTQTPTTTPTQTPTQTPIQTQTPTNTPSSTTAPTDPATPTATPSATAPTTSASTTATATATDSGGFSTAPVTTAPATTATPAATTATGN